MSKEKISPRQFYKLKHPELFSDSKKLDSININENVLAFSLDNITTNNKESDFQNLCAELIKREICPNLMPQTGPTGGGDGKTDTENYPISNSLLMFGQPVESSSERWGFAISATKQWKAKATSDFQKIIDTNRGYSKIYYISNQSISDKKKRDLEDVFFNNNKGIRFIILDKKWIIEKIKKQTNLLLLNEYLGFQIEEENLIGARDYERIKKLAELKEKYSKASNKEKYDISIEIVTISRSLEVSKEEIVGYISQLYDLDIVKNNIKYKIDTIYFSAWTYFWWYEDYALFYKYYCELENIIENIKNESPHIILDFYESLNNLWLNLHTIFHSNLINVNYYEHTMNIIKKFELIRDDDTKTNLWMCLKPIYYKMQLLIKTANINDETFHEVEEIFNEFAQSIIDAKKSPDFNAIAMIEIFLLNNTGFENFSRYDDFFDKILDIKVERKGQILKARAVLERCPKLMESNEEYKIIKFLGKVFNDLHKEESRFEYISSVAFLGIAFKEVGLLFASRQYFFESLTESLKYFTLNNQFHPSTKHIVKNLIDIELQMGKVMYAIQLNYLDIVMGTYHTSEEQPSFDLFLANLLLKTNLNEIEKLTYFPEYLYNEDLLLSEVILKRMLGHYDEEFQGEKKDELDKFILDIINSPYYNELKSKPFYGYEKNIILKSKVLGCNLEFDVENNGFLIEYASNLIGGVESFLSTEIIRNGFALIPDFKIIVTENKNDQFGHSYDDIEQILTLNFPKINDIFSPSFQQELQKNNFETILLISTMITKDLDIDKFISRNDEEGILERSIFSFSIMHKLINIFGNDNFKYPDCSNYKEYPINDKNPLIIKSKNYHISEEKSITLGDMKYDYMNDLDRVKREFRHGKIEIDDFIEIDLWDKAEWKGFMYLYSPSPQQLPAILVFFDKIEYGEKIFDKWILKYGRVDKEKNFKIEIIKGIDKENPTFYRVAIGSNFSIKEIEENQLFQYRSRIHTMQPESLDNINNFEKYLLKNFYFAPFDYSKFVHLSDDDLQKEVVDVIKNKSIVLNRESINIRWIQDIENVDMLLSSCIYITDNPDIPLDHPISEFIKQKKERK